MKMFGLFKNSRKNHLIRKYKDISDYFSSGSHLSDPESDNMRERKQFLLEEILKEFSVTYEKDIQDQKSELKNMFSYLKSMNKEVRRYDVPYDIAIASELNVSKFAINTKKQVESTLIETCDGFREIIRPLTRI